MLSGWTESERRLDDGAIASDQHALVEQPVVELSAAGALRLAEVYWSEVERSTVGLVRPRVSGDGLELRLLGVGPALLRFGAPRLLADKGAVAATYPIVGGLLTRRAEGTISFRQIAGDRPELVSEIEGFHPTLAARPDAPQWTGELYRQVQARLHSRVSRRYFIRLVREARR